MGLGYLRLNNQHSPKNIFHKPIGENMKHEKGNGTPEMFGIILVLFVVIACIAAWFTHIFVCLSEEAWGFLIAGAIMFPIAIIHGVGIWFGFFW